MGSLRVSDMTSVALCGYFKVFIVWCESVVGVVRVMACVGSLRVSDMTSVDISRFSLCGVRVLWAL